MPEVGDDYHQPISQAPAGVVACVEAAGVLPVPRTAERVQCVVRVRAPVPEDEVWRRRTAWRFDLTVAGQRRCVVLTDALELILDESRAVLDDEHPAADAAGSSALASAPLVARGDTAVCASLQACIGDLISASSHPSFAADDPAAAAAAPFLPVLYAVWASERNAPQALMKALQPLLPSADMLPLTMAALREHVASTCYTAAVHAFMVHADTEALWLAQHLNDTWPDLADRFGPGRELMLDLQRRCRQGNCTDTDDGKETAPDDASGVGQDCASLLHQLQDVAVLQHQPRLVDFAADPCVSAILQLREAAVPALLDALESDRRLTRSVTYFRAYDASRDIVRVRKVILWLLSRLLGLSVVEACCKGVQALDEQDSDARKVAGELRSFWAVAQHQTYAQRLRTVILDPTLAQHERLESARRLIQGYVTGDADALALSGPDVGGTLAQALVSLTDVPAARRRGFLFKHKRRGIESTWARLLAAAATVDAAAVARAVCTAWPDIMTPYAAASTDTAALTLGLRIDLAVILHRSGTSAPLLDLATALRERVLDPSQDFSSKAIGKPELRLLEDLVRGLSLLPAASDAVCDLARTPSHPLFRPLVTMTLQRLPPYKATDPEAAWMLRQRFLVHLLTHLLSDTSPTNMLYQVEVQDVKACTPTVTQRKSARLSRCVSEGTLRTAGFAVRIEDPKGTQVAYEWPSKAWWPDTTACRDVGNLSCDERRNLGACLQQDPVVPRVCDVAAQLLHRVVRGVPLVHPVLQQCDQRVAELRETMQAGSVSWDSQAEVFVLE